jgi:hypothetical protein
VVRFVALVPREPETALDGPADLVNSGSIVTSRLPRNRSDRRRTDSGPLSNGRALATGHWHLVAGLIISYALLSRIFIAFAIPPWQGPDEPKHFEYVRLLVDKREQLWNERRLLEVEDAVPQLQERILTSMARSHFWEYLGRSDLTPLPSSFSQAFGASPTQLNRPSAYYVMGALVLLPLPGLGLEDQLRAVRVLSALLGALTVAVTYFTGQRIASQDAFVPVIGAAFVATLPMNVYMNGMVNNDNLLWLSGSLVVLGVTEGIKRAFSVRTWAVILGGLVLGLTSKRGAVILLPGILGTVGVSWASMRDPILRRRAGALVASAVIVGVIAVVGAVYGLWRFDRLQSAARTYLLNPQSQLEGLLHVPYGSPEVGRVVGVELDALFTSFWGMFGWFTTPLSSSTYFVLFVATCVCAIGFLAWCIQLVIRDAQRGGRLLIVAVVYAIFIATAIVVAVAERLAYFSVNEVPQGRYLFVVLGCIALVLTLGARALLPPRFVGTLAPTVLVLGLLVALDVDALLGTIVPFFSRSFS